jgi:hypothetical protein
MSSIVKSMTQQATIHDTPRVNYQPMLSELARENSAQRIQHSLLVHTLMRGHQTQDTIQRSDAYGAVVGNGDSLMRWRIGLQDDVAAS